MAGAWLEMVTWGLIVEWQRMKEENGKSAQVAKVLLLCNLCTVNAQSTYSQHTVNIQSTHSQHQQKSMFLVGFCYILS